MLYFRDEVNWQNGQLYFFNNFSCAIFHNRYCYEEYKDKKIVTAIAAAENAAIAVEVFSSEIACRNKKL